MWSERLRVETEVLHRANEELRVEYEARLRQAEADLHDAVAKVCQSNHFAAFYFFFVTPLLQRFFQTKEEAVEDNSQLETKWTERLQAETEALRRANEEAQSDLQAKLEQSTAALQEALSMVSRQYSSCQEFHTRFNFRHLHFAKFSRIQSIDICQLIAAPHDLPHLLIDFFSF